MTSKWPFIFYVFNFAGYACVSPFLVLYYQSADFTGSQIGFLTGITPLVMTLGAPFWTALADTTQGHRLILNIALLVGFLTMLVFPFFNSFLPVLLIAVLFFLFFAPVSSLADSATMYMLGDRKEMYGRVRMGGTIGFGVAAFVAGSLVQNYGISLAFWGCAVMMLLSLITSQKLVHNPQRMKGSTRGGIRVLLANRRWLLFLMLAFAGGVGLAGTNTYLFPFMKELGAGEATMGLALTIGTISEIPVLFFGHHLVRRFKPFGLLVMAIVFTGLRLLAFAASGTPNLVLTVQLFNGLAFPVMWIAGVTYAYENAPVGLAASAQGMFGAMVFGFGSALGGFAGGPLLASIGGRGTYNVFGLAVLLIVGMVIFLQKYLPKEVVQTAQLIE